MMSKKIAQFILVLAILVLPLWLYFGLNEHQAKKSIEEIIRKKHGAERIYVGGSTLSFAVRDSNNMADLSEPYIFTLKKIELIQPKQVVLSVGLNYFLKHYDECYDHGLLNKPSYRYLESYLTSEERNDIAQLMSFETKAFSVSKTILPFLGSKLLVENDRLFGGDFSKAKESDLSEFKINQRVKEMFPHDTVEWSLHQKQYFWGILSYCKFHNIKVILLSTPINEKLYSLYSKQALNGYNRFMEDNVKYFGIKWLDLSTEKMPDSCFYDGDHLNDAGAERLRYILGTQ